MQRKSTAGFVKKIAIQKTIVFPMERVERKLRAMKTKVNEVQEDKNTSSQSAPSSKKLMQGSFSAPRETLSQAAKINMPSVLPKPPENILADPSIIVIRQICIRLACKDILEINDVVRKLMPDP
jgi:hypothetical protein